jgi:hypothetical protein
MSDNCVLDQYVILTWSLAILFRSVTTGRPLAQSLDHRRKTGRALDHPLDAADTEIDTLEVLLKKMTVRIAASISPVGNMTIISIQTQKTKSTKKKLPPEIGRWTPLGEALGVTRTSIDLRVLIANVAATGIGTETVVVVIAIAPILPSTSRTQKMRMSPMPSLATREAEVTVIATGTVIETARRTVIATVTEIAIVIGKRNVTVKTAIELAKKIGSDPEPTARKVRTTTTVTRIGIRAVIVANAVSATIARRRSPHVPAATHLAATTMRCRRPLQRPAKPPPHSTPQPT